MKTRNLKKLGSWEHISLEPKPQKRVAHNTQFVEGVVGTKLVDPTLRHKHHIVTIVYMHLYQNINNKTQCANALKKEGHTTPNLEGSCRHQIS